MVDFISHPGFYPLTKHSVLHGKTESLRRLRSGQKPPEVEGSNSFAVVNVSGNESRDAVQDGLHTQRSCAMKTNHFYRDSRI
jgi:hypothetical protein